MVTHTKVNRIPEVNNARVKSPWAEVFPVIQRALSGRRSIFHAWQDLHEKQVGFSELSKRDDNSWCSGADPGAPLSKDPITYRSRKAICLKKKAVYMYESLHTS